MAGGTECRFTRRACRVTSWVAGLVICSISVVSAAAAQGNGLRMELNKLEERGEACRAYLVLENAVDADFSAFKIDFVMFDGNGVIAKRLAVDFAPLRPGKTTVQLFDIPGVACADTGRILINDVIDCRIGEEKRQNCVAFVTPASRTDVKLVK